MVASRWWPFRTANDYANTAADIIGVGCFLFNQDGRAALTHNLLSIGHPKEVEFVNKTDKRQVKIY